MNFKMKLLYALLCFICIRLSVTQDIYETVEAIAGHSVEIPCNVSTESPEQQLQIVAWYKNGTKTALYGRDFRKGAVQIENVSEKMTLDGRYRVIEGEGVYNLTIQNLTPSDSGLYYCMADFVSNPVRKTYVQLVVIEPPERIWVGHDNGTRIITATTRSVTHNLGPYYVGDTVHLFCVAYGGKPQPTLSWWGPKVHQLKHTFTPLSNRRIRIDLKYGPLRREDHGLVLTCLAQNNNISTPVSVDLTLDMYLPPELVSVRVLNEGGISGAGRAGESLKLQCRVLGARPTPNVVWTLNNNQLYNIEQNVSVQSSQRLVVSEVEIVLLRELDESRVSCCVDGRKRRNQTYICAESIPLTVHYPPHLEVTVDSELENNTLKVVKGSNITLNCSIDANPWIYDFTWYHGEDIINSNVLQPILNLNEVTVSDAGEYVCAGSNTEGATTSDPIILDIIYAPYCTEDAVSDFGLGENESMNLTCDVTANPEPSSYKWMLVNSAVNVSTMTNNTPCYIVETEDKVLKYTRPNDTNYATVFCWGVNGVESEEKLPRRSCTFLITDETVPRMPSTCVATKNTLNDITIQCIKGHDGGLPQKFTLIVKSLTSDSEIISIINLEPQFIIQEPNVDEYKLIIVAFNEKGESDAVTISQDDIIDESEGTDSPMVKSSVSNITTLSLSLCGGVALLALAACGLVLCAHERVPRSHSREPALTAFNTEESNCGTCHESDEGSDCNVRRTDSFRRAVSSKYTPKPYDVRRTSSFHSTRYMNDLDDIGLSKCSGDVIRHGNSCRVHSLQNINRRRDTEAMCDHYMMKVPTDLPHYSIPRAAFYTMPRKPRQKQTKDISDETSELTQNSDGFSLPPPPDEFSSYRAGIRVNGRDAIKSTGQNQITANKDSIEDDKNPFNEVIISPMNTVGLPTVCGQKNLYTYPEDDHTQRTTVRGLSTLSTFQRNYTPKESGL